MRINLRRGLALAAALASVAVAAPLVGVSPASAATSNGTVTLNPTTGDGDQLFNLVFPATPTCPGDSVTGGFNWTAFMVPIATNLDTLGFDGLGPTGFGGSTYGTWATALYDAAGNPQAAQLVNTGSNIVPVTGTQFSFGLFAPNEVPSGAYKVGVSCHTGGVNTTYWAQDLTITNGTVTAGNPNGITYAQGVAPSAPVVDAPGGSGASANGDTQITVDVDPAGTGGTPTSYDITVKNGAATVATRNVVSANPGGEVFTGLTNGTTYDVTATATNSTGTSGDSTAVQFTPTLTVAAQTPPVVTANGGPAVGTVVATWTAAGGSPASYDVTISPAPNTGPATQTVPAAGPLTATFTDLTPGAPYTVTVTPTGYPAGQSATPGSDGAIATSGDGTPATLVQTIQVQREQVNAIVFEQDCDGDTFLGGNGPLPYGTTTCIVDLGAATLDTTGSYYEADGELWPIRVIDHRDTDKGWKITGVIDPNFTDGAKSFDANALGWDPKELSQSGPLVNGYAMTVDEGPVVPVWSAGQTLKNGAILATSVASGGIQRGLGTAIYSADLDIQIPISVASGDYSANITFTLVNLT